MAKKSEVEESVDDNAIDLIEKEVFKNYGSGILNNISKIVDNKPEVISISPLTDIGLYGGIPLGSWVIYSGVPKSGKTSCILHAAKQCQLAGMNIYYLNIEGRLKPMNLIGIGFDPAKFRIIESSADKILSAQDYLTIADAILKRDFRACLIIDSWSCLIDEAELVGGIGTQTRGGINKILAQFSRLMSNVVPMRKHIVLGVVHLMANTSGYGAHMQEKGGNGIMYQSDIKLRCKSHELWRSNGEDGDVIGKKITWSVDWCALGSPGGSFENYFRFNHGIDEVTELLSLACDLGVIDKPAKGCWLTYGEHKKQGLNNMYDFIKDNPEIFEEIKVKVKEILGT